jgi:hypothetical protein
VVLVCLVLGLDAGEAVDAAVAKPVAGAFEGAHRLFTALATRLTLIHEAGG